MSQLSSNILPSQAKGQSAELAERQIIRSGPLGSSPKTIRHPLSWVFIPNMLPKNVVERKALRTDFARKTRVRTRNHFHSKETLGINIQMLPKVSNLILENNI